MSKLAALLFKDYRRRVLNLLLLHPDQKYHVREIARITNTVAGTLHKELARLADAGVLCKESVGNQLEYWANRNCIIFEELAGILRKTSGITDVLADALVPIAHKIDIAFVFGSVASGKETEFSDVDVIVVGWVSFSEVVNALYSAQNILQREVNPRVFSREEWLLLKKSKDAFLMEIAAKPKLFVQGEINDLG
ncbi:MAG: nucleotidyltransferase domain-containing protein [Thiohalomonadales bacterium]